MSNGASENVHRRNLLSFPVEKAELNIFSIPIRKLDFTMKKREKDTAGTVSIFFKKYCGKNTVMKKSTAVKFYSVVPSCPPLTAEL